MFKSFVSVEKPGIKKEHAHVAKVQAAIGALLWFGAAGAGYLAYRTGTDTGGETLAPLEFLAETIASLGLITQGVVAFADSNHASNLANGVYDTPTEVPHLGVSAQQINS